MFRLPPHGFRNRDLRGLLAGLLGQTADHISAGQATYDLRRLRTHSLINRIPGSHRYRVTDTGLHHTRLLQPGLAHLTDPDRPRPTSPQRTAALDYNRALDRHTQQAGFAA